MFLGSRASISSIWPSGNARTTWRDDPAGAAGGCRVISQKKVQVRQRAIDVPDQQRAVAGRRPGDHLRDEHESAGSGLRLRSSRGSGWRSRKYPAISDVDQDERDQDQRRDLAADAPGS